MTPEQRAARERLDSWLRYHARDLNQPREAVEAQADLRLVLTALDDLEREVGAVRAAGDHLDRLLRETAAERDAALSEFGSLKAMAEVIARERDAALARADQLVNENATIAGQVTEMQTRAEAAEASNAYERACNIAACEERTKEHRRADRAEARERALRGAADLVLIVFETLTASRGKLAEVKAQQIQQRALSRAVDGLRAALAPSALEPRGGGPTEAQAGMAAPESATPGPDGSRLSGPEPDIEVTEVVRMPPRSKETVMLVRPGSVVVSREAVEAVREAITRLRQFAEAGLLEITAEAVTAEAIARILTDAEAALRDLGGPTDGK